MTLRIIVNTITALNITCDPTKEAINIIAKHGVSLLASAEIEWDMQLATEDTRRNYGEVRMIGYAPIGERVYCVVFTDRGANRRVISLRKANAKEGKRYVDRIKIGS